MFHQFSFTFISMQALTTLAIGIVILNSLIQWCSLIFPMLALIRCLALANSKHRLVKRATNQQPTMKEHERNKSIKHTKPIRKTHNKSAKKYLKSACGYSISTENQIAGHHKPKNEMGSERNRPRISFERNMKRLIDSRIQVHGFSARFRKIAIRGRRKFPPANGVQHCLRSPQNSYHLEEIINTELPFSAIWWSILRNCRKKRLKRIKSNAENSEKSLRLSNVSADSH